MEKKSHKKNLTKISSVGEREIEFIKKKKYFLTI